MHCQTVPVHMNWCAHVPAAVFRGGDTSCRRHQAPPSSLCLQQVSPDNVGQSREGTSPAGALGGSVLTSCRRRIVDPKRIRRGDVVLAQFKVMYMYSPTNNKQFMKFLYWKLNNNAQLLSYALMVYALFFD